MICIDTTVPIDEFRARGSRDAPVNRAMLTYGAEMLIVPVMAGSLPSIFALIRLGNRRLLDCRGGTGHGSIQPCGITSFS
jgi:hypothetical protein